jgi:hypothetical protein
MADDRRTRDRRVQRSCECHRLEDQLWSLAYQQLWPVIRKQPKAKGTPTNQRHCERPSPTSQILRRA